MSDKYDSQDAALERDMDREVSILLSRSDSDDELAAIQPTRTIHVPIQEPDRDQLSIDQLTPAEREATLQERFLAFHEANPHVYTELVKLARRFKRAGNKQCGMKMLFEVVRYRRGLTTSGEDFKLNNNFTSRYARLIMSAEADLKGFFETRELHAR